MSENTSENTEKEKILEHLICPICLVHPENQVYQCQNQHPVCSSCILRLQTCPQCQIPFGNVRIPFRLMESLLDIVSIPCFNKDAGCTKQLLRKELSTHHKTCEFRSVSLCKWMGYECNFTAANAETLVNHLESCHNAQRWSGLFCKNFSPECQLRELIIQEFPRDSESSEKAWLLLLIRFQVDPINQRCFSCVPILLQDGGAITEHGVHLAVLIHQDNKKLGLSKWIVYTSSYKDAEEDILNPSFRLSNNYIARQARKFGTLTGFNLSLHFSIVAALPNPSTSTQQQDVNSSQQ